MWPRLSENPAYATFLKTSDNHMDNDVQEAVKALDADYPTFEKLDVLVVGCLEDPFANLLSEAGAVVTGVDYRESGKGDIDNGFSQDKYTHIVGDMKEIVLPKRYDLAVSISAIEHSGLGYYGDQRDPDGDVKTIANIYNHMKPGGRFYVTVPIGGSWHETYHWRRYTVESISRIIGPFKEVSRKYFCTARKGKEEVSEEVVKAYHQSTEISILLKLEK